MPTTTTSSTVLDGLFSLGERLCLALEAGDVDAVARLIEERGVLVEQLHRFAHPADADPDWQELAAAFGQQHHAIVEAAAAHEQRLEAALEALGHVKHARARYNERPSRAPILNKHLCV